ncbi:lysozyme [Falsirhodobacter sp. 20TX0035]|uniref:lysozyme n=1 Tax=Falsirhodobacter sp. 20TX0035 TaxID=3022019 RepID=UPI00232D505F|nr:lysozyme [Falsirhodobacter sp. 20TX0035]MDB6453565.1 lysozyme [Falsirhodobacter sp. 20TX0035]
MQVSDRGLVALMQHEGIVPGPYMDSVNVPTYGIGHTAAAGAPDPADLPVGMPADLDRALAEVAAVFRRDLARYTEDVLVAVRVDLAPHELDALVSFHYNTGAIAKASLTEALNAGDRARAGALFLSWKKPAEIIPRRTAERDLFLHGTYPKGPVSVWQVDSRRRVIWTPARTLSAAEALTLVAGDAAAPVGPLAYGSRDSRNRTIQTVLNDMGLYARTIDDRWGPGQQAALDDLAARNARIKSLIHGE